MKRIYLYTLPILAVFSLSGCGEKGGNNASYADAKNEAVVFKSGTTFNVNEGDSVTPLTQETKINVTHSINDDTKQVTVLSGEISYIAGNYTVK
jgi:predicted small lipoprotein YifL